jgi:signal transduction histidine kinase
VLTNLTDSGAGGAVSHLVHDLNNVLSVIAAQATMLRKSPTRAQSIATTLAEATDIACDLARQIARRPAERTDVDVGTTIARWTTLLADISDPQLEIAVNVEPGLPTVHCSATALDQVVLNALLNAREAVGSCGMIGISARVRDGFVELTVTDSGAGIPAALLSAVLRGGLSTKAAGRGIGLASMQRLVAAEGGRLSVGTGPRGTMVTTTWSPSGSP